MVARKIQTVSRLAMIGAIVAAALTGCAGANAKPSPTATLKTSASPEASATPEALTVQSIEIPASLTPEQMGEALIDRLSSWELAGATDSNRKLYIAEGQSTGDADAKSREIANTNGAIYAEALFGTDWISDPKLATFVPNKEAGNAQAISKWFKTTGLGRPPYTYSMTVIPNGLTYTQNSDGSITERIPFSESDNAGLSDQNEIMVATFSNVNGVEKISNFDVLKS